ncbi:hypothetical protein JCM8547_009316 [Rhodosporidiobolus lusitaniae]
MAGFRDDDADFGDLLAQQGGFGAPTSSFASFSTSPPRDNGDSLEANPFADMESSSFMPYTAASSAVESPFYQVPTSASSGGGAGGDEVYEPVKEEEQTPFQPVEEEDQTPFQPEADLDLPPPVPVVADPYTSSSGGFEPSTPSSPGGFGGFSDSTVPPPARSSFSRESAPEPETPAPVHASASFHKQQQQPSRFYQQQQQSPVPAPPPTEQPRHAPGDPDAFTYDPSTLYLPFSSTTTPAPLPSSNPPSSPRKPRADLSALLLGGGDEGKPKPSFGGGRKGGKGASGGGGGVGEDGMSRSAILGGRETVGRKQVGGALAALLGMGGEEEEEKKEVKKDTKKAGEKEGMQEGKSVKEEVKREELVEEKRDEQEKTGEEEETEKPAPPAPEAEETSEPPVKPEAAPLPPADAPSPAPVPSAVTEIPLPPSRTASPSPSAQADEPASSSASKPSLERAFSVNVGYEAMVSPLETGETPRPAEGEEGEEKVEGEKAWPENKPVKKEEGDAGEKDEPTAGLDEQLSTLKVADDDAPSPAASIATVAPPSAAPAEDVQTPLASSATTVPTASADPAPPADTSYQQYIFGSSTSPDISTTTSSAASTSETDALTRRPSTATFTSSHGFRAFNGSETDEGVFGGAAGGFGDETDSLRGTYSRSVNVGEIEGEEGPEENNNVGTPTLDRSTGGFDQQLVRTQREGSAPLPPLPPSVPSIQGSPRSTELGGSLGPSFIISVGDPQTVGSALNPAAQHTVYTVRTRTTSSAFRKSDFSVLRRYSHFVWLYEALVQNNPGVIVPGMPEKHAIGRFGSTFVENRRLGLQTALNKIVAHPMLVGDPDLRLFLESDTFHIDIKQRKIDTSSENKGFLAGLSSSIGAGPKFVEHDEYFEHRKASLDVFESQLRSLLASLSSAAKVRSALHASIAELEAAFLALSQCDLSSTLRKLFVDAAGLQKKLHDLAEAQSAHDEQMGGLVSVVESYARLCASAKGVFGARIKAYHTWQAAATNFHKMQASHDKAKKSGRTHSELLNLSVAEIAEDGSLQLVFGNQAERRMLDAQHDFDDVSKLTKAEMARVDKEKVDEFKKALEDYADGLAARQRQVVEAWQQYHDMLAKAVEANNAVEAPPPPAAPSSVVES